MMTICRGLLAPALLVPMLGLATRLAHGIALLSDVGMQKFAAPLPVLVIPEDSASALRPARSESLDQ